MVKEAREQLIKDYTAFFGKHAIGLFEFLELKNEIESEAIFDVNDESYNFTFSLKKIKT